MHDVQADEPEPRMLERLRHSPNHLKAKGLIQPHRGSVGFYDRIELHGSEPLLTSPGQRVLAQCAPDALSARLPSHHKACRGDVRSWTRTVSPHMRGAQDFSTFTGDDSVVRGWLNPDSVRLIG